MEKKIKIQVRDLNLYYGQNHALHGVNMDIKENSVTALIGPSGCGKSTFLKCINRMNDLVDNVRIEGSIEIDGENIYAPSVDTTVLRKKVGMVFQQPNPFPMSIYDNIAYGPRVHGIKDKKILDQIVEESLQGAAIFNEVKDRLKKSAMGLSGGQQQRLCIARALMKKPKVLILDDSTSAVDTRTDALIRQGFREFIPETTKIIIAQRVASVQDADRIIVMEGGRIAQIGNHDELLKTSEIYRETFTSQNKMSAEGEGAVEADTEASATQAQTQEGGEAHE